MRQRRARSQRAWARSRRLKIRCSDPEAHRSVQVARHQADKDTEPERVSKDQVSESEVPGSRVCSVVG